VIDLDATARDRIRDVLASNPSLGGLRVGLTDGGCSGFAYLLDFERAADPEDLVLEVDGARLFVHPMHAPFLKGSRLRWEQGRWQAGFHVDNPNVTHACGCGESVSF
jgi:iron-sulfur cluster assembly protein